MPDNKKQNRVVGERPRIEKYPFFVGQFFQYDDARPPRLWVAIKIESRTCAITFTDASTGPQIAKTDYNPHQHSAVDSYYSGKYVQIAEEDFEEVRKNLKDKI